jgi:SSS family solute:Na+ symporter
MSREAIILILYSLGILGIGLWASKGVKTSGDYLVAGRTLGLWVLVGTLTMTELNTMSLVGFSGKGYQAGIYATMIPVMFLITFIFYMIVYAKRWKRFDVTTTSEFFTARFGSPGLSRMASLLWLVGLLLIVPNYMTGAAVILKMAFNLSFEWSTILICGTVLIFTLIGGLKAVAYTDYASLFLAIVTFPVMTYAAIKQGGGWKELTNTFDSINPAYNHWNGFNMLGDQVLDFKMVVGWIFACFWVFQMAQWYGQKMFAAKNEQTAYWAMGITAILVYVMYASTILTAAFVRVKNPGIQDVEAEPPYAWAIMNFLHNPIWRGLMLANIFAVCQTTVSSVWNSMVSLVTQDLYKGWLRPNASDAQLLRESRWITFALGLWTVFGAIFIIHKFTGIVKGTAIANAFMFIPTIPCLLGFIWRRYHRKAAIWTMIVAAIPSISIICYKGIYKGEAIFFEVFVVTAAVTIFFGILFGYLGKPQPEEVSLREKFYRKVGDPYFRSGYEPVFEPESSGVLSEGLPTEAAKGA